MNTIIIIALIYLVLLFSLVYIFSFVKSKQTRRNVAIGKKYVRLSPSEAIVDSVGGENNASPLGDFLSFVSECRKQSPYFVKGDTDV